MKNLKKILPIKIIILVVAVMIEKLVIPSLKIYLRDAGWDLIKVKRILTTQSTK